MSCVVREPTFRLLDRHVGWDVERQRGVTGLDGEDGVHLAPAGVGSVRAGECLPWLLPPAVAVGCDGDVWVAGHGVLLRGPCDSCFEPVWQGRDGRPPALLAIDVWRDRVAVASTSRVWMLSRHGMRLIATVEVAGGIRDVAWTSQGLLWVASEVGLTLLAQDGDIHAEVAFPPSVVGERIAVGSTEHAPPPGDRLWLFGEGQLHVLEGEDFEPVAPTQLAADIDERLPKITQATDDGFCLVDDQGVRTCWDWQGCPTDLTSTATTGESVRGQLLTRAIDSGLPRCQWHRVRADAQVPTGSSLEVAVATAEEIGAVRGPVAHGDWSDFEAGVPHPLDWQVQRFVAEDGAVDFLVDQPPGRFLFVRLRMVGDVDTTPQVRRVRLDFPRVTSLRHLPAVYADGSEESDFTERFLSIFDATLADLDDCVIRMPALLDAAHTPAQALPWLGRLLGLGFEGYQTESHRRALVRAAPELSRLRGTPHGIARMLSLALGPFPSGAPIVSEPIQHRPWGALGGDRSRGSAQLGAARIFGRSRARFRLGTSALDRTPLNSVGDPDTDVDRTAAARIDIALPPLPGVDRETLEARARQLVAADKPAHTVATIHVGGEAFVVGVRARAGIDSLSLGSPPGVLGAAGSIRLGRAGTLGSKRDRGMRAGGSHVGDGTPLNS